MGDSSGYCPRCGRTGKERDEARRKGEDVMCPTCTPSAATPARFRKKPVVIEAMLSSGR